MKIYKTGETIFIKGYDKVMVKRIWLLLLVIIVFILLPFTSFINMSICTWRLILLGFILMLFILEFSFRFEIVITKDKLSIKRQFLTINTFDFTFQFTKISVVSSEFIRFERGDKTADLEIENGLDNNTIHLYSDGLALEIGRKNDGEKLMKSLSDLLVQSNHLQV